MSEAKTLRERAERCRAMARAFTNDVSERLMELSVELDHRADEIDSGPDTPGPSSPQPS